jgi:hypothetical protein
MEPARRASSPAGGSDAAQRIKPGTTVLVIVVLVLLLSLFGLWSLPEGSLFKLAPLQVLLGSAVFIALIALIVVVFARLGLYDRSAPLGLPEGSVRALLALILLIIFIIFANVIFGQLSEGKGTQVVAYSGLSDEQVTALPGEVETKSQMTPVTGQPTAFEGTYRLQTPNEDAANVGQQVVTGLLTLVAAISAFYFGSGSVAAGAEALRRNQRPGSSVGSGLLILRPSQPATLKAKANGGYEDLVIDLGGSLLDEAGVQAVITGDQAQGRLAVGSSDAQFIYTPSPSPKDPITLRFTSPMDPSSATDLIIHLPEADTTPDPAGGGSQPGGPGTVEHDETETPTKRDLTANPEEGANPARLEPHDEPDQSNGPEVPKGPGMLARVGATLDEALDRLKAQLAHRYGGIRERMVQDRPRPEEPGSAITGV